MIGEKILDFVFEKAIMLPIILTENSKYKAVKLLGGFIYLIWVFPVAFLFLPFIFIGMIILFFEVICSE